MSENETVDVRAAVLAQLYPAPTWCGMTADDLWFRFKYAVRYDLDGWGVAILGDLIAAAAEMNGAQKECADLADERDALLTELDEHLCL